MKSAGSPLVPARLSFICGSSRFACGAAEPSPLRPHSSLVPCVSCVRILFSGALRCDSKALTALTEVVGSTLTRRAFISGILVVGMTVVVMSVWLFPVIVLVELV